MTFRKLQIEGKEWGFFVGKSNILIQLPTSEKVAVPKANFDFDEEEIPDVQDWSGEGNPNFPTRTVISPKKVCEYIAKHFSTSL